MERATRLFVISKLKPDDIIFGFKVKYEGWEQKGTELTPGMERSWQDDVKDTFSGLLEGNK